MLEFFSSINGSILCLTDDKEAEEKLLEMVMSSFHAYNLAVPWLIKLISKEVNKTSE